jgi:hypothetical protein
MGYVEFKYSEYLNYYHIHSPHSNGEPATRPGIPKDFSIEELWSEQDEGIKGNSS